MNILAIECSLPQASLCLYKGDICLFETSWQATRNHDSFLFPALRDAIDALHDEKLGVILVGAGPGSYGGVRVALAAAVGIATVHGADIVALSSWNQLAEEGCMIISDAKRGGWAVSRTPGEIEVLTTEQLVAVSDTGMRIHTIESPGTLQKIGIYPEKEGLTPTACGLVETWNKMNDEQKAQAYLAAPEPIYVRPPHITKALHKPWEIR